MNEYNTVLADTILILLTCLFSHTIHMTLLTLFHSQAFVNLVFHNFYVHSYVQYCTLRKLCSMCQKRFSQNHIKNKHILVITFLKM